MNTNAILEIPQDVLDTARLTVDELRVEIAVYLYAEGRLSIGKARELALWEFRQLLASRRIVPHYDVPDLDEDVATLIGITSPHGELGNRIPHPLTCRKEDAGTI
jgi:predicted HTH domain antitoxin